MLSCIPLLVVACAGASGGGDKNAVADPAGDSAGSHEEVNLEATATLSAHVSTVYTVEWTTERPSTGQVEIWLDGEFQWRTPTAAEATTDHQHIVIGLRASTEYTAIVVGSDDEGTALRSSEMELTTGTLPAWLPTFSAESYGEGPGQGLMLMPVLSGEPDSDQYAVVMIDEEGEVVWHMSEDTSLATTQVILGHDESYLVYIVDDGLVWRSLDGAVLREYKDENLHHTIVELPDGTIGSLRFDPVDIDGENWLDNTLVEIDAEGNERLIWSTYEHLDELGIDFESRQTYGELGHSNALAYDAPNDAWLLGISVVGVVVSIDRASGKTNWVLNTYTPPDVELVGADVEPWSHQHMLQVRDGGFYLYVNQTRDSLCGRVLDVSLEPDTQTAEVQWRYDGQDDTCHTTFSLGDVQRLDNGNTVVTWSTNGELEIVDADSELLHKVNIDFGFALGYGEWLGATWRH